MPIAIRAATRDDVPAILDIYNDVVRTSTASYDYEPSTLAQRQHWFEQHKQQGLSILVAVNDVGAVVGWGSLSNFRDKIGYQYTVEHSVYVAADQRQQGIGRQLLLALIEVARSLGKHIIIGGLDSENVASIRLHQALGFEQVAHFKEVGYKFGRWLDVIFFQLRLASDFNP